jgi:hypothetical protein
VRLYGCRNEIAMKDFTYVVFSLSSPSKRLQLLLPTTRDVRSCSLSCICMCVERSVYQCVSVCLVRDVCVSFWRRYSTALIHLTLINHIRVAWLQLCHVKSHGERCDFSEWRGTPPAASAEDCTPGTRCGSVAMSCSSGRST